MNDSLGRNAPPAPKLGAITAQIYDLLTQHPAGLSITEIREMLGVGESQEHLDRRIRDLRKFYEVPGKHVGGRYIYVLKGPKAKAADGGLISNRIRAEVLHAAKGRCQMCGKDVAEDGIKLQIDHKIPQAWGGLSDVNNLWAICTACNQGKRDFFSSFDASEMQEIVAMDSVHERIAHLLKMHMGHPVPSSLIEFVANATERQEDWQKRLRELRYPPIGLRINVGKKKSPQGYIESTYTLENWREIPADHKQKIREWESRAKHKPKH
jgi:hypothetical protein